MDDSTQHEKQCDRPHTTIKKSCCPLEFQLVSHSFSYSTVFRFSGKIEIYVLFPAFLSFFFFHSTVRWNGKIHLIRNSFFLVNQHQVLSSGQDLVIHLYLKVLEKWMGFIFLNRCCFVHIQFVSVAKFKSFARFLVDHLSHPVRQSRNLFEAGSQHSFIMW